MIGLIGEVIVTMAVVFAAGGLLLYHFNDEESFFRSGGKKVFDSCLLIVIVYCVFIAVYASGQTYEGIPFAGLINGEGSLHELFETDLQSYVLNLMELITVTFVCGLISNLFPANKLFGDHKIAGLFYYIVIVLIGLTINKYIIQYAKDQEFFDLGLIVLRGIIAGGVVTLTPTMIVMQVVTFFTGLDEAAPLALLFADKLPSSGLGKAIKTAFSSSLVFLFALYVIEKQLGDLHRAAGAFAYYITAFTVCGGMIIGMLLVISAVLPHKKRDKD